VPLGTIVWREIEEEDEDEEDAAVDFSSWGSDEPVSNDDDDDDDGVEDARESKPSSDGWTRPRGLSRGKWVVVADLTREGDTCVLARGGRGGKGNKRMPTGREAGTREPGAKGQEFKYVFELKTVADVGLVGLPNAGKSTLLRALSNATPRVGAYAFTTTQPQLGALETSMGHKITVADIPGLIEGAHDNRGLGHNFLRHIERCETLLYVVDLSSADGVSPWRALEILERELEAYLPGLSKRTSVVIGTKMDAPNAPRALETLRTRVAPTRVLAVSALESRGTEDVARVIEKEMEETYTSWK
jgi:GTP-binding protein